MTLRRTVLASFVILSLSRVAGLLREILVAGVFGFSADTDLFFQVGFIMNAIATVCNGPFTTALSAKLAPLTDEQAALHLQHYLPKVLIAAASSAAAVVTAAVYFQTVGSPGSGAASAAFLAAAPGAFSALIVGYTYAALTSIRRVAAASALLAFANIGFVCCVVFVYLIGAEINAWILPSLQSLSLVGAMVFGWTQLHRVVGRRLHSKIWATDGAPPLPGFIGSFALAGVETAFFLLTQVTILILAAGAGEGWVSALSVAQRLVLSVNGFIISPFATVAMQDLFRDDGPRLRRLDRAVALVVLPLAGLSAATIAAAMNSHLLLGVLGLPVGPDSDRFISLIGPMAIWLLPLGANILVCRVMFALGFGRLFTAVTVAGYILANVARVVVFAQAGLSAAIISGAMVEVLVLLFLVARLRMKLRQE